MYLSFMIKQPPQTTLIKIGSVVILEKTTKFTTTKKSLDQEQQVSLTIIISQDP